MRKAAIAACVLCWVFPARAEEILIPEVFANHANVQVALVDQVKDGCLPNPDMPKKSFESELLKSGITVSDTAWTLAELIFVGNALRASNDDIVGCVSIYMLQLESISPISGSLVGVGVNSPLLARVISYQDFGSITGELETFQTQINEVSAELAQTLAVNWLKAHQR